MSMSVLAALAAMAEVSSAAAAQAPEIKPIQVYETTAERPAQNILMAVATGAAAVAIYRNTDESFEFYPLQVSQGGVASSLAQAFTTQRGGFGFALSAYSPKLTSSQQTLPDYRDEARTMAKVMPGYPQPAKLVVGVKVSF